MNINIGDNIIKARGRANISQNELARRTGICQRSISYWEAGARRNGPYFLDAVKIAQACGCSILDLAAEDTTDKTSTA